jgi:hypothetical protein
MLLHVTHAKPMDGYKIKVSFNDGRSGVADVSSLIQQGVFKSLADDRVFRQLEVDSELETVTWPGGLDLAPEYLYFKAFQAEPELAQQFHEWGYVQDTDVEK